MTDGLLFILFTTILTNNFVLVQFLGICPFLGVSKKLDTAMGMSLAVIFVLVLSTAATWPINQLLLAPNNLEYLQTLVFILIIAGLVQLLELVMKKYMVGLYLALGIYLPLIASNCIVLGVVLLNLTNTYTLTESLVHAFGAGAGFMLALFLFAGIRRRIDRSDIPEFLKGIPVVLIAAALTSVTFLGFSGLAEGLFG